MKSQNYFNDRAGITEDERLFWAHPGGGTVWQTAKAWPSGKGVQYLLRALWVRTFWPFIWRLMVVSLVVSTVFGLFFWYAVK